jgi:hypothetical protein
MKESKIQNVELPTWYVMDSEGGEVWLRPSHPMTEERDLEEQEEVTYAPFRIFLILEKKNQV